MSDESLLKIIRGRCAAFRVEPANCAVVVRGTEENRLDHDKTATGGCAEVEVEVEVEVSGSGGAMPGAVSGSGGAMPGAVKSTRMG